MSLFVALGISIGVLAGVLCIICDLLGMTGVAAISILAWPGFVAWACYFAVGGGVNGIKKTMAANTVGILMGGIIILLAGALSFLGGTVSLAVAVAIGAFILCAEAHWKVLDFIPGAFCGCACSFGMGAFFSDFPVMIACILSMWVGALFAHASNLWGNAMVAKKS